MPKVIKYTVPSKDVVVISDLPKPPAGVDLTHLYPQEQSEEARKERQASEEEMRKIERELLLRKAKEEADLLSKRMIKAAEQEREAILSQANLEAFQLKEEAAHNAYHAAYAEMRPDIETTLVKVADLLDEMQRQRSQFLKEYEENLRFLALDIAEKILNKKIAEDDTVLLELVRQAVSTIKGAEWISVEVSEQLPELVEKLRTEFGAKAGETPIEIQAKEGEKGHCVIQTSEAEIDASVSTQVKNLKKVFSEMD